MEGAYFGWMMQDLFHGWISKHFPNYLPPGRPVCLLENGYSSHIDLDTSRLCAVNQILLYCLPPHTSHVLQPLDVFFFSPLKHGKMLLPNISTMKPSPSTSGLCQSVLLSIQECGQAENNGKSFQGKWHLPC